MLVLCHQFSLQFISSTAGKSKETKTEQPQLFGAVTTCLLVCACGQFSHIGRKGSPENTPTSRLVLNPETPSTVSQTFLFAPEMARNSVLCRMDHQGFLENMSGNPHARFTPFRSTDLRLATKSAPGSGD